LEIYWKSNVNSLIAYQEKPLLSGKGSISYAEMENKIAGIYADFDKRRKEFEAKQADEDDLRELESYL